jgi:hypothetical protein
VKTRQDKAKQVWIHDVRERRDAVRAASTAGSMSVHMCVCALSSFHLMHGILEQASQRRIMAQFGLVEADSLACFYLLTINMECMGRSMALSLVRSRSDHPH